MRRLPFVCLHCTVRSLVLVVVVVVVVVVMVVVVAVVVVVVVVVRASAASVRCVVLSSVNKRTICTIIFIRYYYCSYFDTAVLMSKR